MQKISKIDSISADPCREDPDLSRFGGQAYRTCGPAYVVQRDSEPEPDVGVSKEDRLVKQMEAHPDLKKNIDDPMPPFKTVEQRMIDLDQRKLHPLYKKYQSMPKKPKSNNSQLKTPVYKTRSGPIGTYCYVDLVKVKSHLKQNK